LNKDVKERIDKLLARARSLKSPVKVKIQTVVETSWGPEQFPFDVDLNEYYTDEAGVVWSETSAKYTGKPYYHNKYAKNSKPVGKVRPATRDEVEEHMQEIMTQLWDQFGEVFEAEVIRRMERDGVN
jgi:hypothetical protein